VAVLLVLVSAPAVMEVIAAYIYALPPMESQVSIVGMDQTPFSSRTGLIILCSTKARQMGLCTTSVDRKLDAEYAITIDPPPADGMTVTCEVKMKPSQTSRSLNPATPMPLPTFNIVKDFSCIVTKQAPGKFKLDLAFTADRDGWLLSVIGSYVLVVTVDYDEHLLSWIPLFTRKVSGTSAGDLCLLDYHVGDFRSCEEAASWQRQTLSQVPFQRRQAS